MQLNHRSAIVDYSLCVFFATPLICCWWYRAL